MANFSNAAMPLETLRNDDYEDWSVCVRNYLIANDLWDDIIEPTTTDDPKLEDDDLKAAWRRKNAAALLAIHISCDRSVLSKIRKIDSAKIAWDELAKMHSSGKMTPRQWLLVYLIIIFTWLMTKRKRIRQKICISALTGKMYVQELLHGTSTHMFNMLRLKKPAFIMLCDHFRQREWLYDSKHIDVEEKMAMFLMTIGHNKRNRTIVDRFQHSTQTISKCFHEVLVAMLHFSKEMIIDPPFDGAIHKGGSPYQCRLKRGPFRGAVGALDGTLVDAHILLDKQIPFRGRGGKDCIQNVLGVCDFDMRFTYVMAGWEGITHDARVLNETLRWPDKHGFPLPPEACFGEQPFLIDEAKKVEEPNGYAQFVPLINAINKGDLNGVKSFIKCNPRAKTAKIIPYGSTALHLACSHGQVKIVKELVARLSVEDLGLVDNGGCTALAVVAQNPALINIAECLIKKNQELIKIRDSQGVLPVVSAARRHHKDMTHYLYSVTRDERVALDKKNGSMLLSSCILGGILDVALDVIKNNPGFTTTKIVTENSSPIHALSRMNSIFPSGSKISFWKQRIYSCIHVSLPDYSKEFRVNISPHDEESDERRIIRQVSDYIHRLRSTLLGIFGMLIFTSDVRLEMKKLYEEKKMHLQALEILRCMVKEISTIELSGPTYIEVRDSIFRAVQYGTVEFVVQMVKTNPLLLYVRDQNFNGIFQYAVQYRQEKIFSLLYDLDGRKDSLIISVDSWNCTITHLAGVSAPSSQLARISGAALQMQRELHWYQEVKSIVGSIHEFSVNLDGQTPDEVFTTQHKQLAKEGEKWMKQTASSCTVVGALIITVMFTAAFTVPGGNDQNTGYPMFLHKKLFTVFIITDAIALFFSSTSVLMFLGILTSCYTEEDFLKSLPTKLIIGLRFLFISIVSMMIAFCAALILMLGELHIVFPLVWLAYIPISFFAQLQYPLLQEIFKSTYEPRIFDRKMKPWL